MLSEIPLGSPTETPFFLFTFFLLLLLLLVLEAVRDGTHTPPRSPANVRLLTPEEEKKIEGSGRKEKQKRRRRRRGEGKIGDGEGRRHFLLIK